MTERNEFMRFIPQEQLEQIARDARADGLEAASNLAQSELERRREAIAFAALSIGVYDASQDKYDVSEHPDDDRWVIRGSD